jgi:hypothetical protein
MNINLDAKQESSPVIKKMKTYFYFILIALWGNM